MLAEILFIEDNAAVATGITRLLRSLGHACTHASVALQAIEFLAEHVPQVIISDVDLPDLSGVELLKLVRADARTRAVPFIVFSASIDSATGKLMIEWGATACCPKTDVEELLRLIDVSLAA